MSLVETGETERFAMHSRMGLVHIDDVAAAHILVFEKAEAQGRYLCSYTVLENYELAQFLRNRYPDLKIPARYQSVPDAANGFLASLTFRWSSQLLPEI